MESLGDSAPVSAIDGAFFLRSDDGKRTVTRRPDGGLDHDIVLGVGGGLTAYIFADEARALDLPGTSLTWRFLTDGGRSDWRLVLVDERDVVVWVEQKGFFPEGYQPSPEEWYRPFSEEEGYQPSSKPAPADDYDDDPEPWMTKGLGMNDFYCVTVIHDVTPDEALRRFGATEISTTTWSEMRGKVPYGDHVVAAFAFGPHTMLVEKHGYKGVDRPDLSAGTFAVSSYGNADCDADIDFVVSRDGVVIAGLGERAPSPAEGEAAEVLAEALAEMGIDDPLASDIYGNLLNDLELLRRLTGVHPTVADVTGPARVAIIHP
ncbi:DUF6461 domain-containing protein [Lentzea sp.]|uniref:DUF6461 domain-containing protein n=1 Tax=Lentzea sp. TaxID=56099 RepID=UPI002C5C425F|nr:DUF6461 domain-containing protein [Lentzea sp.]HUQ60243.1 DUF6461 domain-containing protein [Lentzea sp.]